MVKGKKKKSMYSMVQKKETIFVHTLLFCNIDLTGVGHEDSNMNY